MFGRRADRPEGEPMNENESNLDKMVRALTPVVKAGTYNIYRGEKKPGFPDLVRTVSVHDEQALAYYQRHGYIVWGEMS